MDGGGGDPAGMVAFLRQLGVPADVIAQVKERTAAAAAAPASAPATANPLAPLTPSPAATACTASGSDVSADPSAANATSSLPAPLRQPACIPMFDVEAVEKALKRNAELLVALSAMSKLRAGKPPGPLELQLASLAHANLAEATAAVSPRTLMPNANYGRVMRDLSLLPPTPDPYAGASARLPIRPSRSPTPTTLDGSPTPLLHELHGGAAPLPATKRRKKFTTSQVGASKEGLPVPLGEADTVCELCKRFSMPSTMLSCDECDKSYHYMCLTPALTSPPAGEWFCPRCLAAKSAKSPMPKSARRALSSIRSPRNQYHGMKLQAAARAHGRQVSEQSAAAGIAANVDDGGDEDEAEDVSWHGDSVRAENGDTFYNSCIVEGQVFHVESCATFLPDEPDKPPYVGRLCEMWETAEGEKQVRVAWYYHASEVPEESKKSAGEAALSEGLNLSREVYESNHYDINPLGSIVNPCRVLTVQQYAAEVKATPDNNVLFWCRWYYNFRSKTVTEVGKRQRKLA
eukprot:jgi/Chlat1/4481/Chrsp29S04421